MNKNKLFPQINGILHGGDYNAEQWLDRLIFWQRISR